jgi:hypothetical protein
VLDPHVNVLALAVSLHPHTSLSVTDISRVSAIKY